MIEGLSVVNSIVDTTDVFRSPIGLWVVDDVLTHKNFGIYALQMRKIVDWETSDVTRTFDKYHFLPGSGHGGQSYFINEPFHKFKNGAVYREILS